MSKYSVSDGHLEEDEQDREPAGPAVEVDHHLIVNDERDEIERYNGLQWRFIFEDAEIVAVDKSHYCPGPGHTDPMGFRAWSDVPETVQNAVLQTMNADGASEVVNLEECEEVAEESWP